MRYCICFLGGILKGIFLDSGSVDPMGTGFDTLKRDLSSWTYFEQTLPKQVLARIQDIEIVVVNKVILDEAILSKATTLKCICVTATGVDNIDVKYAAQKGILVCNVSGYATASVVQHTLALIFSLMSWLPFYHEAVQQGQWSQATGFCLSLFPTREVAGKTLGIIGRGQTGQGVANIAQALGMKILFSERKNTPLSALRSGYVPFSEIIENADIISIHCPLNVQTHHLFSTDEFSKMKSAAIIINIARGKIIDEQALLHALVTKKIAGAGLDVLSEEPPSSDHILLQETLPNLIITPHVAWNTLEARQRLIDESIANVQGYLQNNPRNVVLNS